MAIGSQDRTPPYIIAIWYVSVLHDRRIGCGQADDGAGMSDTEGMTETGARRRRFPDIRTSGHNNALAVTLIGGGPNWAECALDWRPELVANKASGFLASGVIVTLMDVCTSRAVWGAIEDIATSVTLDLRVDYLRPARPGRRVIGRGECYHITQRIAFVRGIAHDGDPDRPVANVAGSFFFTRKG